MRAVLLLLAVWLLATAGTASGGLNAIWRHSPQIQRDGFLTDAFPVEGLPVHMKVRQVPGDGNCLFHSISACLEYASTSKHASLHLNDLMPKSAALRKMAVDYLVADTDRVLYLEGGETVPVNELLTVVATQYNMTVDAYCTHMRLPAVWGGGPEIVALSNCLRRPIHVYELATGSGRRFCFRRMACFGSPLFDEECEPIHILSADARFPNLSPGQQLANGNHFLCLFPCGALDAFLDTHGGDALRGGRVSPRLGWFGRIGERLRRCTFMPQWQTSDAAGGGESVLQQRLRAAAAAAEAAAAEADAELAEGAGAGGKLGGDGREGAAARLESEAAQETAYRSAAAAAGEAVESREGALMEEIQQRVRQELKTPAAPAA